MAQRKSPSYPEWPVDRSVYSLFCGHFRSAEHEDSIHLDRWYIYPPLRATLAVLVWGVKRELKIGQRRVGDANGWSLTLAYSVSVAGSVLFCCIDHILLLLNCWHRCGCFVFLHSKYCFGYYCISYLNSTFPSKQCLFQLEFFLNGYLCRDVNYSIKIILVYFLWSLRWVIKNFCLRCIFF